MDAGKIESTDFGPSESSVGFAIPRAGLSEIEAVLPESGVQVLLIIDDARRLGDVARLLTASGLRVERVSDPYGAGAVARSGHRFSVILLDVLLPTRDLYRLCRQLRTSGRVPLVIASWEDRTDLDAGPRDRIVPHSSSAAELADGVRAAVVDLGPRSAVMD